MTTYNVLVPVVELVDTDSPKQAWESLAIRLRQAGFTVYEDPGATFVNVTVFEVEGH